MRTYYHGGPDGFSVGRWLLPPSITRVRTYNADAAADLGMPNPAAADRVYLATQPEIALLFAASHKRPMIYVVEPDGDVEPDPDYSGPPGQSVACKRARIVRRMPLSPAEIQAARQVLFGVLGGGPDR